jgi:signal transduction histidine kinase
MDAETGACRYVGPQALATFGYELAKWQSPGFLTDLMHPDDRPRWEEKVAALGTHPHFEVEYRMRTASGTTLEVRSVVSMGLTAGGRSLLRGLSFDITRQKKLEFDLQQAQKLESVGRLASGIAHEINTPVQFVSDSVHFVRDAVGDMAGLIEKYQAVRRAVLDGTPAADAAAAAGEAEDEADLSYLLENVPKALERSLDGLQRVATIVRSMKQFAHPDQRERTTANINEAVMSTLTIARNEYKYVADVRTELDELPPVPCYVGDLNQAVLNLVVNAAHAIADVVQGTETRGEIVVRTWQEDGHACISIRDTGGGIPAHVRDRVFEPFFTTKEVGKGTGQGLAIARSVVVDKHGGQLTFESEIGRGTTFVIRIPIAAPGARGAEAAA